MILTLSRVVGAAACLVALAWPALATLGAGGKPMAPRTREFDFTYAATLTGLKPGQRVRVWLPVPQTTEDQEITLVSEKLPAKAETAKESKYGNRMLSFEARADDAGTVPMAITYRVKRSEVVGQLRRNKLSAEDAGLFLKPDRMVPIGGRPQELIQGKKVPEDPMAAAKLFYDAVNEFLTYSKKGTGWGRGDVDWVCDNRYGNCTDFHSMFISLARTGKIPAKFEMGFPLPPARGKGEVGGYHCWALFSPDAKHWVPVDISEANRARESNPKMVQYYFGNLTEDRVTFTVGRDLDLVPLQKGPPLNYFIYPYAEVEGRPVPADAIRSSFTYQDVTR